VIGRTCATERRSADGPEKDPQVGAEAIKPVARLAVGIGTQARGAR
jgi:hypothetical protein